MIKKMTSELGASPITLMIHLDRSDYPGLLKEVANQFLGQHVSKLLPEELQEGATFHNIMTQAKNDFETKKEQSFTRDALNLAKPYVDKNSPSHEKFALVAHIEFCTENPLRAISLGIDVLIENTVPGPWINSPAKIRRKREMIEQVETRLIQIFLKTIEQMHNQKT